jgi:formylglycine-generating enzyme required for sulfatase activity
MVNQLLTAARILLLFFALVIVQKSGYAITIETVPIGNPGNSADMFVDANDDPVGFGSVSYRYRIGKYEVTNSQYVEFLNGVDPTGSNTLSLYSTSMSFEARGGIDFGSGAANGSKYSVKPGRGANPVIFVTWYDAVRFTNWLHNGQGGGDTENGAYTLLGGTATPSNGDSITRNVGAKWWIPSEDEWYKAAYHKNDGVTANYWQYPTQKNSDIEPYSDQPPGSDAPDPSHSVNYFRSDGVANGYNDGYAVTGSILTQPVNYLTDVGAYTLAVGPYGTFDQAGNVAEWNEALFEAPVPGLGDYWRGVRGGSWGDNNANLLRSGFGSSGPPGGGLGGNSIGFRVSTVIPEPNTLMLSTMAVVGLVWRRRRLVRSAGRRNY